VKAPTLQFGPQTPDDSAARGASMKRQSGKNQTITMRGRREIQRLLAGRRFSIVLNNCAVGAVHRASHEKNAIEEAAKKLGYRPNAMARFLRSKRSIALG